jgi:hypothetical protein
VAKNSVDSSFVLFWQNFEREEFLSNMLHISTPRTKSESSKIVCFQQIKSKTPEPSKVKNDCFSGTLMCHFEDQTFRNGKTS